MHRKLLLVGGLLFMSIIYSHLVDNILHIFAHIIASNNTCKKLQQEEKKNVALILNEYIFTIFIIFNVRSVNGGNISLKMMMK